MYSGSYNLVSMLQRKHILFIDSQKAPRNIQIIQNIDLKLRDRDAVNHENNVYYYDAPS